MPSATIRPPVEQGDAVGERVGLLEVLGREEGRDTTRDQGADVVPHLSSAARVEPGRRLVEEGHLGPPQQRHRQVEATAHPSGVRGGGTVGRLDEVEPSHELGDARRPVCPAQVVQGRHQAAGSPSR